MDVNGGEGAVFVNESRLSESLMSPFCPGRTLSACPSEEAVKLRSEIRGMFKEGKGEEEIQGVLVSRYGADIRGIPAADGVGVLIWAAPATFLFLSLLLLIFFVRRNRGIVPPAGDEDVPD